MFILSPLDILGSEYGWDHDKILHDVDAYEFFRLKQKIDVRNIQNRLMELAIVASPSAGKVKQVQDYLTSQLPREVQIMEEKLDRDALIRLKGQINGNRIGVSRKRA